MAETAAGSEAVPTAPAEPDETGPAGTQRLTYFSDALVPALRRGVRFVRRRMGKAA
jgi:hypothetical protein